APHVVSRLRAGNRAKRRLVPPRRRRRPCRRRSGYALWRCGREQGCMEDKYALITTLVAAIVLAFVFGFIAQRLRLSPILGYLFAGLAVGPHTPGFTGDTEFALQLSEIGVILLMFGVGLKI